jgi:hypothetical protein
MTVVDKMIGDIMAVYEMTVDEMTITVMTADVITIRHFYSLFLRFGSI